MEKEQLNKKLQELQGKAVYCEQQHKNFYEELLLTIGKINMIKELLEEEEKNGKEEKN